MDFSAHPLSTSRQSIVDESNKLKQSTIDYTTDKLRLTLRDTELGSGLVAQALKYLGEAEVTSIADYAVRKGEHPGKLFVGICKKELLKKGI